MEQSEFSSIYTALVRQGHEMNGIEVKSPGSCIFPLRDLVIKAMIGMANRRSGGLVIIGLTDNGTSLEPGGLTPEHLSSWSHDDLAARIHELAEPSVRFRLGRFSEDDRAFLVIEVDEFDTVPVICRRSVDRPKGNGQILRQGACYVRSRRKNETVPVATYEDMRDLLDLATTKGIRDWALQATEAGISLSNTSLDDASRYAQEIQPFTESEFVQQISDVGYWDIIIRPLIHKEDRIPHFSDLLPLVRAAQVRLPQMGKPYPILFNDSERRGETQGSVGANHSWDIVLDSWRFYQSGQFVNYAAYLSDLLAGQVQGDSRLASSPPGSFLFVRDCIRILTEVFRFAFELQSVPQLAGDLEVKVTAHRLSERELYLDGRSAPMFGALRAYRTTIPEYSDTFVLTESSLANDPDNLAIRLASNLFERFSWIPGEDRLQEYQSEFT